MCVYTRIRSVIQAPGHPTIFHKSRRTVQAAEHAHGGQLSWVGPVPEVLRRQFADGRLEVARAGVALWCDGDRMRESDMSDLTIRTNHPTSAPSPMVRVGHEDKEHVVGRGERVKVRPEQDIPPLALLPLYKRGVGWIDASNQSPSQHGSRCQVGQGQAKLTEVP